MERLHPGRKEHGHQLSAGAAAPNDTTPQELSRLLQLSYVVNKFPELLKQLIELLALGALFGALFGGAATSRIELPPVPCAEEVSR
jgi:hypothetical protein